MKDRIRSITSILRKKAEGLRDKEESGSADVELINALSQPTIDSLTTPAFDLSEAYILKLIQELEVHQVELEMQNQELSFQNQEKEKQGAELKKANIELLFQNEEKEKRAQELIFANKEIAIQKDRLEKISSLVPGVVFQYRLRHDGSSCFPYASDAINQIYRVSPEEIREDASGIFANIHPDDLDGFNISIQHSASELSSWQHEFRVKFDDGAIRVLYGSALPQSEDDGSVLWHGIITDITDRRQMEEALHESERQRMRILNDIQDVVWSLLWPDMTVNYISPSAEQLFGRPLQDFIANPSLWASMVHPEDKHLSDLAFEQLLKEGSALRKCRIVRPDGSIVWISDSSKVIFGKDNTIIRLDGISRDITASHQAEIYGEISHEILQILNANEDFPDSVQSIINTLKIRTGFDAVGIRLQDGDDYPYYAQKGFSADFLLTENTLIGRTNAGGLCRDMNGCINLECTCGLVISGNTDPGNQFFTSGGSIWTNDSLLFLHLAPDKDPRFHPRNKCIHQGYASVALIPIRNKEKNIGLIQFNDHRKGSFTTDIIERLEGIASHIGEALMRKQAEEELKKSNELLSLFLNHSPIFTFIKEVSPTESRTLKASENYREMVGIPGSEMVGKTMYDLFPAELAASITADDWAVVSEGKQLELEEELNGHIYTSIKFPIPLKDKNLLAGFSIDVTDRKLLEKKLKESEKQYRLLFETAHEGILVVQGENFKFVNPMVLELTGYTRVELLTMYIMDMVHPDDKEFVKNNFLKRIKGELAENRYHLRIYKKDRSIRWFELSGVKTEWEGEPAVIIFVADITDQLAAEEALKKSEAHAHAIINALPDMMFMMNREGIFLDYKAAREDLIYQSQSIIGIKNRDIAPPEFADLIDEKIEQTLETGEMQLFEYQFLMPSGEYRDYEARMVSGGSEEVIVIVRNITERKKAELEIQLKNEALQRVNSEKDKLFSIIAHDLFNPFQTLLGFSSAMGEDLLNLPLEKIQKIAVNMRASANKLFYLLENLLEWSQIQRSVLGFKPRSFLLSDKISDIIDVVCDTADKKMITISHEIPEGLNIMADMQMFESLMRNLIFNAVKFTPNGGKVYITALPVSDNSVEISVSDTGIGMDQNMIDHLFQLNEQVNRCGTEGESSTGLGLIICKDFIERHRGEIVVESEVGKGSTFRFTLPRQIKYMP